MRFITYLATLLIATFLSACGGGGGAPGLPSGTLNKITTTAPEKMTIEIGASQDYVIAGGREPYQVSSDNVKAAVGVVSGKNLFIGGKDPGTAVLVITDAAQQSTTVTVTVPSFPALYTTAPSFVRLSPGASAAYVIGGGAPGGYTVSSTDTEVVSVGVFGNKLTITGIKSFVGSATVTIREPGGTSVSIDVVVVNLVPLFTTAPSTVRLSPGVSETYLIGGGVPDYTASTTDTEVVSVSLIGSSLKITAIKSFVGTATVTVRDSAGTTVALPVKVETLVPLFTTAPSTVSFQVGGSATYGVGGGLSPYVATSSDTSVASVSLGENGLTITAIKLGTATVELRDQAGKLVSIKVEVKEDAPVALFTTAPISLNVKIGETRSYAVSGGKSPYSVTSSNTNVATVSGAFSVTGIAVGTAKVVISDSLGAQKTIDVTVDPVNSLVLFTTAPSNLTLGTGGTASTYTIGGGVAGYTATSSNASVVSSSVSGTTLTLTGLATGTATVVIRDQAGASVSINVTVSAALALFTTAPSSGVTIAPAAELTFTVGGGTPDYTATSSNNSVVTASVISGTTLRLLAGVVGSANVLVRDAAGATVSVAVTVSSVGVKFAVSPTTVEAFINMPVSVVLVGGTPPYRAGGSIPAAVSVVKDLSDGSKFVVTPLAVSTGLDITFLDSQNATAVLKVTGIVGQPTIRLSPNALTVSENIARTFELQLFGAKRSLTVFSSDTTLLTATIPAAATAPSTTVTVTQSLKCVATDTPVTITVVDFDSTVSPATSTIATSVVTIKDNGNTSAVVGPPAVAANSCPP